MRTVTVKRIEDGDQGTFGVLITDHGFRCNVGELPDRDNHPMLSRIPSGEYQCELMFSPHFKRMVYHILDVPGRKNVEIHVGNWCGDTTKGFKSDVLGCMILGSHLAIMGGQKAVTNSKDTFEKFLTEMDNEGFKLIIKDKE